MEQKKGLAEDQDRLLEPFDIIPHEDIQAASLAMGVIEELDSLLLTEEEAEMVNRIKKMALYITHQALWEIYDANNYGSENN